LVPFLQEVEAVVVQVAVEVVSAVLVAVVVVLVADVNMRSVE
jgi:hypothetical protein